MNKDGIMRNLTAQQKKVMEKIFEITNTRLGFMQKVEASMRQEYDNKIKEYKYQCLICGHQEIGNAIGAHYKNNKECRIKKKEMQMQNSACKKKIKI